MLVYQRVPSLKLTAKGSANWWLVQMMKSPFGAHLQVLLLLVLGRVLPHVFNGWNPKNWWLVFQVRNLGGCFWSGEAAVIFQLWEGIWYLGGGFKYFLFSPLLGEDFSCDSYFLDGLKPPTSIHLPLLNFPNQGKKHQHWDAFFVFGVGYTPS